MATIIQRRRGTTAQHATFTGADGEITIDTDKDAIVVHDGTTAGGFVGGGFLPAGTGAVRRSSESKLREFVSRADYDSDANYNTARNALTGRADHRLRVEGGTADRLLSAKLAEFVSIIDFGADPTGVADSTAAIQAAIDYVEQTGRTGGIVFVPRGAYRCSNAIRVGGFVTLRGENYFSSSLFWDSTYTLGNCIELGPDQSGNFVFSGSYTFGSRIEDLDLNAGDVYRGVDKAVVYTVGAHQFSGLFNCFVRNFRSIGVHHDLATGGAATFVLDQVEIQSSSNAPTLGDTIGLRCSGAGAYIDARGLIVQGTTTRSMAAGIKMEKDHLVLNGGHVEYCTAGVQLLQNESTVRTNSITGLTGHSSVPDLVVVGTTVNLTYTLNNVSSTTISPTSLNVLRDLNRVITIGAVGGTSIGHYTNIGLEPRLVRKVSNANDAFQFEVTKRTQSSGTGDVILQVTVPPDEYFIGIEATLIGSRAPFAGVGTSQVQRAFFTIARNGPGTDVVLDNNPGSLNQAATTTSAGGAGNKEAITPNIVRAGAEANTDPQVVNITVSSRTVAGTTGHVVGTFRVLVLGVSTDVVVA
jgi:hypothetical protein